MESQAVTAGPRERTTAFVLRMADAVGANAAASAAFAPAVSQDGTTVVPVALSLWGFGAGKGDRAPQGTTPAESGLGGGGGAVVRPVGYLVMRDGHVAYRPITSLPALVLAGLAGALLASLALRRRGTLARPAYEW